MTGKTYRVGSVHWFFSLYTEQKGFPIVSFCKATKWPPVTAPWDNRSEVQPETSQELTDELKSQVPSIPLPNTTTELQRDGGWAEGARLDFTS